MLAACGALFVAVLLSLALGARPIAPSVVADVLLYGGHSDEDEVYGRCASREPSSA